MASRAEEARVTFNRKYPKNKIIRVKVGKARVAPNLIQIYTNESNFSFWMQNFPSNCVLFKVMYIVSGAS